MGKIITDEMMKAKSEIIVQRPLGRLTLNAEQVKTLLDNKKIVDSILFMLINGDDTFENDWDVEFSKEEAKKFLTNYFIDSGFAKEFVKKSIENIK